MMTITRGVTLTLLALALVSCKPVPPASGDPGTAAPPGNPDSGTTVTPGTPDTGTEAPPGKADPGTPGNADPRRAADLTDLRAEVTRMIGDAKCSDVSQCRTIAFGAKPCGGPWQYLVYSTAITDTTALAAAVARYNAKEAELNKSEGRVSDCMFVGPPTLARVNGRCVTSPPTPSP